MWVPLKHFQKRAMAGIYKRRALTLSAIISFLVLLGKKVYGTPAKMEHLIRQ